MMGRGRLTKRAHRAAMAGMALLVAVPVALGAAWAVAAPEPVRVSQKGRAFQPGQVSLARNAKVQIVNDDLDLVHHAYVESDDFTFDSGDIQPGGKAEIAFTKSGVFTVLCGIHPKMKLFVRVD